MSESEQRMNNTQSENDANTSEQRWDLGTLFPAKGDSRKPPEWLGRALLYIAIAIVVFTFCWRSWGKIEYLVIDIIVSLFIALAVEPVVVPLVKHGWKRSFASLFSLLMLAVILGVLFTLFGNLFVQQVIALVNGLPDLYEQMCQFVSQYANFQLPEINNLGNEILKNIQTSWVTDFAGTALNTVSGLFSFLINLMTVIMTTYYISAAGPKLRRAACQWMAPGGSAPIPVRMDGEPEPDLVIPVLPCHSRIAERVLHRNLSDVAARTLLATVGAVLRYGFAVHSYAGHVYRRRIAGAVRVGQLRIVASRSGADVHLRVSAD